MARLADPRNSIGARGVERSETRMPGALSLCARKEKVTRRKGETINSHHYRCGGYLTLRDAFAESVRPSDASR